MIYIIALCLGGAVIGVDQLTKYLIMKNFALGEGCDFIKGVIDIQYIHNRGAAWGIFSGKTWLLLIMTALVMIICVFLLVKTFKGSRLILFAMALVISGGMGNMYDRVFRDGNVVDFLHFEFWLDFPVFNVADCAICVGAGLMILYLVLETAKEFKTKKETVSKETESEDGSN